MDAHSFQEQWVEKPEQVFEDALDIPSSVVEKLYARPSLVDDSGRMILMDDDMKGLDFSKYDRELRKSLDLCSMSIDNETSDQYKQRLRGQLQIPDLMLICAAKERVFSDGDDFKDALEKSASHAKYPKENWYKKFEEDGIENEFSNIEKNLRTIISLMIYLVMSGVKDREIKRNIRFGNQPYKSGWTI